MHPSLVEKSMKFHPLVVINILLWDIGNLKHLKLHTMDNQGKRKEQIEFSEKMTFWSLVSIIAIIVSLIILNR